MPASLKKFQLFGEIVCIVEYTRWASPLPAWERETEHCDVWLPHPRVGTNLASFTTTQVVCRLRPADAKLSVWTI